MAVVEARRVPVGQAHRVVLVAHLAQARERGRVGRVDAHAIPRVLVVDRAGVGVEQHLVHRVELAAGDRLGGRVRQCGDGRGGAACQEQEPREEESLCQGQAHRAIVANLLVHSPAWTTTRVSTAPLRR